MALLRHEEFKRTLSLFFSKQENNRNGFTLSSLIKYKKEQKKKEVK